MIAARLLWWSGWLLNRLPPSWARWAPTPVVRAGYRQLYRQMQEDLY